MARVSGSLRARRIRRVPIGLTRSQSIRMPLEATDELERVWRLR